jgi:hypothetical protein
MPRTERGRNALADGQPNHPANTGARAIARRLVRTVRRVGGDIVAIPGAQQRSATIVEADPVLPGGAEPPGVGAERSTCGWPLDQVSNDQVTRKREGLTSRSWAGSSTRGAASLGGTVRCQ